MAINGIIGILGGIVNVEVNKTFQLTPAIIYDYFLSYETPTSDFTYESASQSVATVSGSGVVTAVGAVDATCELVVHYTDDNGKTYQDILDVIIRPEGWAPVDPGIVTDDAAPENILQGKIATVNGVHIVGTAKCYVEDYTLYMPNGLISVG